MKQKEVVAEILTCPICGSNKRFGESVAQEQVMKGVFRGDVTYGLHEAGGKVYDPQMTKKMLFKSTVPVISALIDVCLGFPGKPCGNLYARQLLRWEEPAEAIIAKGG